MTQETGY